jgi:hypothetical protein
MVLVLVLVNKFINIKNIMATSTSDALVAKAKAMVAQTKAQGSTSFAGSSYDTSAKSAVAPASSSSSNAFTQAYAGLTPAEQTAYSAANPNVDLSTGAPKVTPVAVATPVAQPTPAKPVVTSQPAQDNMNSIQQYLDNLNNTIATMQANKAVVTTPEQDQTLAASKAKSDAQIAILKANLASATQPDPNAGADGKTPVAPKYSVLNPDGTVTTQYDTKGKALPLNQNDQIQKGIKDAEQQKADAYQNYIDQVNQIRNGSFPLSSTEQALVQATQASIDRAVKSQKVINDNYAKGTEMVAGNMGLSRYSPLLAMGMITNALNVGNQKIADIESKGLEEMAKLQEGFETKDYKLIQDSYDALTAHLKDKTTTLQNMQKEVDAQTKAILDQENKLRDDELAFLKYQVQQDQFQQTADATAEYRKTTTDISRGNLKVSQSNLAETQKKNTVERINKIVEFDEDFQNGPIADKRDYIIRLGGDPKDFGL